MRTLILYYDRSHTPLERVAAALPAGDDPVVLCIDAGWGGADEAIGHAAMPVVTVDARHQFADEFLARAIKSNARYDGGYFLSAALSRPMIAAVAAQHAVEVGAGAVVHGFSGNDALRVTSGLRVLAPHLLIRTVKDLCGASGLPDGSAYTVSSNLWGDSIEGGPLDDPARPPPESVWDRRDANSVRVSLDFEEGVPVGLDGQRMRLADLITVLTTIGRRYGAGRFDVVEHGHVGLKTRAVYDAPAAAALVAAHEDLERIVCSRREHRVKRLVDGEWSEAVYDGLWFDPLRPTLDRLIDAINERVTGRTLLELTAGGARVVARQSPYAIYDEAHAVHRAGQTFGGHLIAELAEQQSLPARLARMQAHGGSRCSA